MPIYTFTGKEGLAFILEQALAIRGELFTNERGERKNATFVLKNEATKGIAYIDFKLIPDEPSVTLVLNLANKAYIMGIKGAPLVINVNDVSYNNGVPNLTVDELSSHKEKVQKIQAYMDEKYTKLFDWFAVESADIISKADTQTDSVFGGLSQEEQKVIIFIQEEICVLLNSPNINSINKITTAFQKYNEEKSRFLWQILAILCSRHDGAELRNVMSITKGLNKKRDEIFGNVYAEMCEVIKMAAYYFLEIARSDIISFLLTSSLSEDLGGITKGLWHALATNYNKISTAANSVKLRVVLKGVVDEAKSINQDKKDFFRKFLFGCAAAEPEDLLGYRNFLDKLTRLLNKPKDDYTKKTRSEWLENLCTCLSEVLNIPLAEFNLLRETKISIEGYKQRFATQKSLFESKQKEASEVKYELRLMAGIVKTSVEQIKINQIIEDQALPEENTSLPIWIFLQISLIDAIGKRLTQAINLKPQESQGINFKQK